MSDQNVYLVGSEVLTVGTQISATCKHSANVIPGRSLDVHDTGLDRCATLQVSREMVSGNKTPVSNVTSATLPAIRRNITCSIHKSNPMMTSE